MYKACIFDLDGTLTDTLESLTFSVNETLKEVALPAITEEQCRTFVGNGAKVLIEQSLKAAGDTKLLLFEKAFEAYGRIFDRNCTYHVKPYPGIREMLLKLKDQNMKLGVLSNKPDRQAVHVVEEIFGKETFDLVWGQREGVPRKPDPSALFAMAESLDHILSKWRTYTDEEAFIFAETDGVLHNTITPIARKKDGMYELDLTLRNNITTEEHPLGVYHPHEELHHIKKECLSIII